MSSPLVCNDHNLNYSGVFNRIQTTRSKFALLLVKKKIRVVCKVKNFLLRDLACSKEPLTGSKNKVITLID